MISITEIDRGLEVTIDKEDTFFLTNEETEELYKLLINRVIKESMKDVTNG